MADTSNKRSNKIATPKTTGSGSPALQPLADPLETLTRVIGAKVKITTAAPHAQSLEGTLFTACPILNVVALNTRADAGAASPNVGDYHVIPVSRIQSFQLVTLAPAGQDTFASFQPAIGRVDTKQLQAREDARVAQLKEADRDRGKGVTQEAQAIYDSLKRINLPVRWHNQEIIVHEAVIITPPYRPEDCKAPREKQEALNRVKKVLEGERRKLKEAEERERRAAVGAAPRKGG